MPQLASQSISTRRECETFSGIRLDWNMFEGGQRGIIGKMKVGLSIGFSRICILC